MSNPCKEARCPTLCCRDNHISGTDITEYYDFAKGIRHVTITSGTKIRIIGGMINHLRRCHTPKQRRETCKMVPINDNTTYTFIDEEQDRYEIVSIGKCPHLVMGSCNIYSRRPDGCRNFDFDGRDCRSLRRNSAR